MTTKGEIVLPASVLRALERTAFVNRQASSDEKLRVLVQLPVQGVLPYFAGDPVYNEAALRKGFPNLSAEQLTVAAAALNELLRDYLRLLRAQRRRTGGWVQNW